MLLEEKIDRFRNALVGRCAVWLAVLGFVPAARGLLSANEQFDCPICRLIRAWQREKPRLAARFSRLCAACSGIFWGDENWVACCMACLWERYREAAWLPGLCFEVGWTRQKVPIFLRNHNWRN